MATAKTSTKTNTTTTEEVVNEAPVKTTKTPAKTTKKYAPDDLIECRSVFPGKYLFSGPKTNIVYKFAASGDTAWIEFQDLQSAMVAKQKAIMAPRIVIEDENLLEDVHWAAVKKIYDTIMSVGDINELIALPMAQFKTNFEKLPIGVKKKVCLTISTMVNDGTFSEMNKIRLVDEACNTNIALLLSR